MVCVDVYDDESLILRNGRLSGILLDTGALSTYLVSLYDALKGTGYRYKLDEKDFADSISDYLHALAANSVFFAITPHTLTECWAIIKSRLDDVAYDVYETVLGVLLSCKEQYVEHTTLLSHKHVIRLGVADVACLCTTECKDCKLMISTDDELLRHSSELGVMTISKHQIRAWHAYATS